MNMTKLSPTKRQPGMHMITTEAQTLDEAIDIIKARQKRKRTLRGATLAQELQLNKLHQFTKPVTLSDRTVAPKIRPPDRRRKPDVVWSREEVIEKFATGMFHITDLAKRAKVPTLMVKYWVNRDDWVPEQWTCGCEKIKSGRGNRSVFGHRTHCPRCGQFWKVEHGIPLTKKEKRQNGKGRVSQGLPAERGGNDEAEECRLSATPQPDESKKWSKDV
jgi:hypothetical protein